MRNLPPAHPNSWYVPAQSDELTVGQVLTRRVAGHDVVLYRTKTGEVRAVNAYCPHMGAHLGHGGEVVEDTIRCPFHHFRFDAEGDCVSAYPGKKVPPACKLPTWPVQEKNGSIFVYWNAEGLAPGWEVPALDTEGWRPIRHATWDLKGHPQECSENSVDIGHFAVVHEYSQIDELIPAHVDGHILHAKYHMHRDRGAMQPEVSTEFELWVHGLGYSVVQVYIERYDMHMRTFVMPCPTDEGHIALRLAVSMKSLDSKMALHPLAALVPQAVLEWAIERGALKAYTDDVRQDFDVWNHKTYIPRPRLAAGDGPISLYRKYVRQFYPGGRVQSAAAK